MSQRNREAFLHDLGYRHPFDKSPIEVPDGWYGGEVVNTGGNIMCRIWRTWETGERKDDTEFEVIYDVSQDASVSLQACTWDERDEGYMFDHIIESQTADEQDDYAQAKVARELMQSHPETN